MKLAYCTNIWNHHQGPVCTELAKLLGPDWHKTLFDSYGEFKAEEKNRNKSEEILKAEFTEQILTAFYEAMDYVFRDGFGTGSKTAESFLDGLKNLLFG